MCTSTDIDNSLEMSQPTVENVSKAPEPVLVPIDIQHVHKCVEITQNFMLRSHHERLFVNMLSGQNAPRQEELIGEINSFLEKENVRMMMVGSLNQEGGLDYKIQTEIKTLDLKTMLAILTILAKCIVQFDLFAAELNTYFEQNKITVRLVPYGEKDRISYRFKRM